jgi:hypothetical protein
MKTPRFGSLLSTLLLGGLAVQLVGCGPQALSDPGPAVADPLAAKNADLAPPARPATTPPPKTGISIPTSTTVVTTTIAPTIVPPGPFVSPPAESLTADLPPPADISAPVTQTLESGDGWSRVHVTGSAVDAVTGAPTAVDDEYVVINGRGAIDKTSLSAPARQALTAKFAAVPAPAVGDDEIIIVPKRLDDAAQAPFASYGLCDDENGKSVSESYTFDRVVPYHLSDTGNLSGTGDFAARFKGTVSGVVSFDIKFSWCIPSIVLHRVTVTGNADVIGNAVIDAAFSDQWSWSTQLADPTLGTVVLPGLPIPVTFTLPITAGIDASAQAQLHFNGAYEAQGAFNVWCNGGGCTGSSSATHAFTPQGSPNFSVNGTATVTPWVEGAVHANVLADWVAYAEVGVRAKLGGQLWAHDGTGCGDGDGNGHDESVSALTLDLNIGIDVLAKAGILGDDLGPWDWNVWNHELGFWSLGDTSAMAPMFTSAGISNSALTTANMRASMRPCWPYTDAVTYRVTWNDGAVDYISGPPSQVLPVQHRFAGYGVRTFHIDAVSDAAGRQINAGVDHSVFFNPVGSITTVGTATFSLAD